MCVCIYPHLRVWLLILKREEGEKNEIEKEKDTDRQTDINVREKHISIASRRCPDLGLDLQLM